MSVCLQLSILICSVPERSKELQSLYESLLKQVTGKAVEILTIIDNRKRTIGEKRQNLLQIANGKFTVFVDDDDRVTDDYVDEILRAIAENPRAHCINYIVQVSLNKGPYLPCYYSIKNKYQNLPDRYLRLPNTRCCIRRDIALKHPIKPVNYFEDDDWAARLIQDLKIEVNIPKVLYYYDYVDKGTNWFKTT